MFPFPDSSLLCNHLCGFCQMGHVVYHLTYIVLFAVRSFVFPPVGRKQFLFFFFVHFSVRVCSVYLSTHMLRFMLVRRISLCHLDRYSDLIWSSFTIYTAFTLLDSCNYGNPVQLSRLSRVDQFIKFKNNMQLKYCLLNICSCTSCSYLLEQLFPQGSPNNSNKFNISLEREKVREGENTLFLGDYRALMVRSDDR